MICTATPTFHSAGLGAAVAMCPPAELGDEGTGNKRIGNNSSKDTIRMMVLLPCSPTYLLHFRLVLSARQPSIGASGQPVEQIFLLFSVRQTHRENATAVDIRLSPDQASGNH